MIKLQNDFNYYYETYGLLAYSNDFESSKTELIKGLDNLGIAGEKVYEIHLMIWEKAILDFYNKKNITKDYDFFFNNAITETCFPLTMLILISEYYEQIKEKKISKNDLLNTIVNIVCSLAGIDDSTKDLSPLEFYEFLLPLDFSESEKWKLFSLYQLPIELTNKLIKLIDDNLELCKDIYKKLDIEKLIIKVFNTLKSFDDEMPILKLAKGLPIYPSFSDPLSQIILETKCYFGIMHFDIFKKDDFSKEIDENTLLKLKLLSDRSKFQILMNLKKRPMYSLELANEIGLSPGTVSHHMSSLLHTGLVTVDKNSGKVYYQLNCNTVKELIERLGILLI